MGRSKYFAQQRPFLNFAGTIPKITGGLPKIKEIPIYFAGAIYEFAGGIHGFAGAIPKIAGGIPKIKKTFNNFAGGLHDFAGAIPKIAGASQK